MDKSVRQIAVLAGIVYFIQGALGVAGVALPLYLRGLGWSVTKIAQISSLAAAPWVFKILYGFISDSFPLFGYRRKSYLILCSAFSSLGWFLLTVLPSETRWIGFCMLLSNLGFATVDVVTDGLIVEYSRGPLNSFFQSVAWGARSAGALLSGYTGGWLAGHWPAHSVFLLTACLPLLGIGATFFVKESKHVSAPFCSLLEPIQRCFILIKTSTVRWYFGVLLALSIGASFGMPFFFFMKETLGFDETFLGTLSSLGWGGAMLGSLIYFRFLRKAKQKKVLQLAIVINVINIFSVMLITQFWSAVLLIFIGGIMGCISMLTVMTASAALTHRSGVEGTFFAVLMGVFNLGQIMFGYVGGKVYAMIGLYPLILLTGVLALGGVVFARRVNFNIRFSES